MHNFHALWKAIFLSLWRKITPGGIIMEIQDHTIKYEDIQWGAIEGELVNSIPETETKIQQCEHTPEMMVPHDLIEYSKYQICISECIACGEEIEEIIPLDE